MAQLGCVPKPVNLDSRVWVTTRGWLSRLQDGAPHGHFRYLQWSDMGPLQMAENKWGFTGGYFTAATYNCYLEDHPRTCKWLITPNWGYSPSKWP